MILDLTQKVVDDEKRRVLYSKYLSDSERQRIESDLSITISSDALNRQRQEFSLLKNVQIDVHKKIKASSGSNLAALNATYIDGIASELEDIVSSINSYVTDLQSILPNRPATQTGKDELIDDILDTFSRIKFSKVESYNPVETTHNLGVAIDGLDDFLSNKTSAREKTKTIVVRQLADRYYRAVNEVSSFYDLPDNIQEIRFIDGDQEVLELGGATSASIASDGTVSVEFDSGNTIDLQIKLTSAKTRTTATVAPQVDLRSDIEASVSSLSEKFAEESWACLALSLADSIADSVNSFISKLEKISNSFKFQKNNFSGFGSNSRPGSSVYVNAGSLRRSLNKIRRPSSVDSKLLGVKTTFLDRENNSSFNICGENKEAYCGVNKAVSDLVDTLLSALDNLSVNIDGLDISSLKSAVESFLDSISISFDFDSIRNDICAVINKGLSLIPKSISDIASWVTTTTSIISAFRSSLSPQASDLDDEITKLNAWGYDAAADALQAGNLRAFLEMEEVETTNPGKAAKILEEAANMAEQSGEFQLAVQSRIAASAYKTEHTKLTLQGSVKQAVINRYRKEKTVSIATKEHLKEYTDSLVNTLEENGIIV